MIPTPLIFSAFSTAGIFLHNAFILSSAEEGKGGSERSDRVWKLETNLDDCTGEDIGFAMDQLFLAGARDVYTQPIGMKKSRPGVLLSVICMPEDADRLAGILLRHTTTLGVRRQNMSRYALERSVRTVNTSYGPVRVTGRAGPAPGCFPGGHPERADFK